MTWSFDTDPELLGLADGPTDVHKATVAGQFLRDDQHSSDLWPIEHLPRRLVAARGEYAKYIAHEVGNW